MKMDKTRLASRSGRTAWPGTASHRRAASSGRAFLLVAVMLALGISAMAIEQTHPLSQVTPMNVSLNMEQRGVFNASSVNVTDSAGTPLISLQPTGNIFATGNLTYSGRTFILDKAAFNTSSGGFNITTGNLTVDNGSIRIVNGGIFFNDTNSTDPIPMIRMFGGGMTGDTNRPILSHSTLAPRLGLFFNGTGGSSGNDTFYFQQSSGIPVLSISIGNNYAAMVAFCIDRDNVCSAPGLGNLAVHNGAVCVARSGVNQECNLGPPGTLFVAGNVTVKGTFIVNSNVTINGSLAIKERFPNASFHLNGSNWVSSGSGQLLITGTRGNVVGPAIRIDANYSGGIGGHQWDIISTATGAPEPEGSLAFWDNTISRDVLVIQGGQGTGKVAINTSVVATRALGIRGNASATGGFATGGPDVAEAINVSDMSIEPGDVLVADDEAVAARKSSRPFDTRAIGFVSTHPGFTMYPPEGMEVNRTLSTNERLLALAGRAPVKVTDENGPIKPGDLLTTSSTPGHAMRYSLPEFTGDETPQERLAKLNENERRMHSIIGKALQPLQSGKGKVIAMVMLG